MQICDETIITIQGMNNWERLVHKRLQILTFPVTVGIDYEE